MNSFLSFDLWRLIFSLIALTIHFCALSQAIITGTVLDARHGKPIEYVNIGIKETDVGTSSMKGGTFSISIPPEYQLDTLTFSMVGYEEFHIPVRQYYAGGNLTIRLIENATGLQELVITGDRYVEKRFGIRRRGLIHFTDGMFKKDDSFEIGR